MTKRAHADHRDGDDGAHRSLWWLVPVLLVSTLAFGPWRMDSVDGGLAAAPEQALEHRVFLPGVWGVVELAQEVGRSATPDIGLPEVTAVAAEDDLLYVADSDSRRLHLLEIAADGGVQALATLDWGGEPGLDALSPVIQGMVVDGDYLYLLALSTRHMIADPGLKSMLLVVDRQRPIAPRIVGSLGLSEMAFDLAVAGPWIYVGGISQDPGDGSVGQYLIVLDVSSPAAPRRHAEVPIEVWPIDVELDGDRLYLAGVGASERSVLQVVHLSPPDRPRPMGSLTRASQSTNIGGFDSLAVRQDRAFVAEDGLVYAADVSSPDEPRWLARLQGDFLRFAPLELGWLGESLVVVGADALHVLDPALPPEVAGEFSIHRPDIRGRVDLPMREVSKEIQDHLVLARDRAFISDYAGVTIVDLSAPTAPRVVGRLGQ